jgi:hypothetical protein
MAGNSVFLHDGHGLFCRTGRFSNFEIMYIVQTIIVVLLAVAAILWLFRKSIFPKKFDSSDCGDGDCGCH